MAPKWKTGYENWNPDRKRGGHPLYLEADYDELCGKTEVDQIASRCIDLLRITKHGQKAVEDIDGDGDQGVWYNNNHVPKLWKLASKIPAVKNKHLQLLVVEKLKAEYPLLRFTATGCEMVSAPDTDPRQHEDPSAAPMPDWCKPWQVISDRTLHFLVHSQKERIQGNPALQNPVLASQSEKPRRTAQAQKPATPVRGSALC
ncbi:hypothetical protein LTR95_008672 [Oleoguttula sp. CCFEE 5521]